MMASQKVPGARGVPPAALTGSISAPTGAGDVLESGATGITAASCKPYGLRATPFAYLKKYR